MAGRISNFGGGMRPLSARDVLLTPTQKAAFPGSWGKFLLEEVQIADDTDAIRFMGMIASTLNWYLSAT
jgi:hypothetical protein